MADGLGPLGRTGIQFFGRMSASIAHEIKNVLAIVNENAGLLEDFTLMAEKGMPLEPQRLERLAENLMKQVKRADDIVKNMSKFAHSADEFKKSVDLNELLSVAVRLATRFADMRRVTLDLRLNPSPAALVTDPFLLENLLWCCLDFSMDQAGSRGAVSVALEKSDAGAIIGFSGLKALEHGGTRPFPTEEAQLLSETLAARIKIDVEGCRLSLILSTGSSASGLAVP